MRKLKFRDFGKVDNRMHYWDINDAQSSWVTPDQEVTETMQFTGLLDKNGKEIYEGDIVEVNTFEHGNIRMHVIYDAPSFFLSPSIGEKINVMKFSTPNIHETVIGNIYENINLLNN